MAPPISNKKSDKLSAAQKKAFLEQRLKRNRKSGSKPTGIPQRPQATPAPLSYSQEGLWYLEQLQPNTATYNIPFAWRVTGELDVTALERSLNAIVQRHEALRTSFEVNDGQPLQTISPNLAVRVEVIDLQHLPEAGREDQAIALVNEEAHQPFDLTQAPLLRARLVQVAPDNYFFILTLHHIVSDGWSLGVLAHELSVFYAAFSTEQPPADLAALPIQYADFAVWQREWLQGPVLEEQLAYWRERLGDDPAPLQLPLKRPRPPKQTFRGSQYTVTLPKESLEAFKALSQQENTTLFMPLLAVWKTLLYRYSRQDDILVGTPLANRNRTETEALIGFFVNTLVLRTDLSGNPTFRELLGRVREVTLGAFAHQDLPFDKLVEKLQPDRDPSRNPFFQVMFVFLNTPEAAIELTADLTIKPWPIQARTARFDLTLYLIETPTGLEAKFVYNTDLFDAPTIERMAAHFQALLSGVIANPDRPVSELPLLTPAERRQILVEWNRTALAYPQAQYIPHLFEAQVERTPEATAVVAEGEGLTYGQLNAKANQLAHYLQKRGVGPDVMVGLYVNRSLDMVIGLLGILKAGGAYVPLDPVYSAERLDFILSDTQLPVLLTQAPLAETLAESKRELICLDTDWEAIAQEKPDNPAAPLTLDNLVYVIYTSGSTGRPKGVGVAQRQLLNYVKGILARLEPSPGFVFATLSTFATDLGNTAIFPALCGGGCLQIVSAERASDPDALADYFRRHPIDCLKIVPSHLAALLISERHQPILPRRCLVLGGEASHWDLIEKVQNLAPDCVIFNHYGPTETTVGVLTYRVDKNSDEQLATVPLGRPLANTQIYLLDPSLEPVPILAPGELYIGGASVTPGYLNRPRLTAEKFIPNPFSDDPAARLYRTGDLARYLPTGDIEFLGRIDNQVKIRGFRIELGEIETALREHAAVENCLVIAREDTPGDKRLVAYIISSRTAKVTPADLRQFLKEKLPAYMIPAAFVTIDEFPLTANGKIDRRKLPEPDLSPLERDQAFVAPRTQFEEMVAEIWADVLRRERLGIYDNFFELGGHSLLATQVAARLATLFQIDIPIRRLFESPTVADLAGYIQTGRQTKQSLPAPPIEPVSREATLPASFSQQRLWILEQLEPGNPFYHLPYTCRLTGTLNITALEQSLNEIIRRHETLRTTIRTHEGRPSQVITPALTLTLQPFIDLSAYSPPEREAQIQQFNAAATEQPFDLAEGPLIRAKLLRLDDASHVLILVLHHIVADGWSRGVFYRELSTLYQAFAADQPSPLPALSFQYADFALWQHRRLADHSLDTQLAYWKTQLAGAPPLLELPVDYPRPDERSHRGGQQTVTLPPALSQGLKALSYREKATLFMTLLAAFKLLLYRLTGQPDLVVGSPIANRNHAGLETLIGFFINTLVLRTHLADSLTFSQLLAQVRQTALEAYDHQDLPFEKLIEELQPERNRSYTPLFQVFFNMLNLGERKLALPGLTIEHLPASEPGAEFDLTLYAYEHDEAISLSYLYNLDLFEPARIAAMLDQLVHLLTQLVENPDQEIAAYSLASPATRALLPDPTIRLPEPAQELVTDMIMQRARQAPRQVALKQGHQTWGYARLIEQADKFARTLASEGLTPGDAAAIHAPRSFGLVAGMIGVFLSGGVLVLIDPELPPERKQVIMKEAQVKYLLHAADDPTEAGWLVDQEVATKILQMKTATGQIAGAASAEALETVSLPAVGPDDPAYIFFTSGTTGTPKGILGRHKGLSHFLKWQGETFDIGPDDRTAQLTGLSFDVVLRDIFLALTRGAALCLPDTAGAIGFDKLFDWLEREQITVLHTVPALAQTWLAHTPPGRTLPDLRWTFFAGEPLPETLAHRWRAVFPRTEIINLYGPTETTLAKCYYRLPEKPRPGVQPVGRPLPQTQALVLDGSRRLCGVGETGEIVLRTPFRSYGYINAAAEQQKRFVKNPFRADEQDLLYFTGDLGRYRPDGTLDILGRLDDQVKVRGVRIELGEIVAALSQHPAVKACAIMPHKDPQGQTYLTAYALPETSASIPPSELRSFLSQKLAPAMIPSIFMLLDHLPLTPNGKIDRRKLPEPDLTQLDREKTFVAPRTQLEEMTAEIWADVLHLEQVGVHDNFFELGGHSLLATQIASRVAAMFQIDLPLRRLFELPTIADLAGYIQTNLQRESALNAPPIKPVSRAEPLPLSFAQQRLWFLDQLKPGSVVYNLSYTCRLNGPLQATTLEQSLNELVCRHEILRTTFRKEAGQPVQIIAPPAPVCLPVVDLQNLPEADQQIQTERLVREEMSRPFDLTKGPLWRAKLLRLDEETHILSLIIHHIVSDGWSRGVFYRELLTLYEALVTDRPDPLPALSIQYADFAVWQRQWLTGDPLETQLAYWRSQLADLPVLELPTDHPRPPVLTTSGKQRPMSVSAAQLEALKTLSRQENVSLFMTLAAAFKTLLYRYTWQEDIAIGAPIANRNRPEIEPLIGFFVNTLVLRTDLSGDPTFRELLARVRDVALNAYAHQDLPFEKLVEELQPERDVSRTPFFQVMFMLHNTPKATLEREDLTLTPWSFDRETAKLDLTVSLVETAAGLKGTFEYNTDLFEPETIEQLATHFQTLLSALAADPDQPISQLSFLTEAERRQILFEWNDTARDYPDARCFPQLFEAQVERTPDGPAVRYEESQLTYQELNERANQLAHHLISLGVGPEVRVGLCLERSLDVIIAMLATLKAGGAYIPLSANLPAERIDFILKDTQAAVLLTHSTLQQKLPRSGVRIVYLTSDGRNGAHHSGDNPPQTPQPDNLAYLLFTSGSTGAPKGVAIEHRQLLNYLQAITRRLRLTPGLSYALVSTFSADLGNTCIFPALSSGGCLHIISPERTTNANALADYFHRHQIDCLKIVPSHLAALLTAADPERVLPRRRLILGGEATPREMAAQIQALASDELVIFNHYGPTETTVGVTTYEVTAERPAYYTPTLPLGRPLDNTQLYLLDAQLEPTPVGVPGELYIGGKGVAREYINRPDLTAERFIPNPYAANGAGPILYKTGDLARYLRDGNLEFLGRVDHQVKIRGFRIEPGEIEAAIRQHEAVKEALVMVREDRPGDKRLTAYVTVPPDHELPASVLHRFLKERLPEIMVPTAFVRLERFPLNANGKIDRRALPAPDQNRPEGEDAFVGPSTLLEEQLAFVWADILGLERVSVDDNFFDLGGHSLLAVRLLTQIEQVTGQAVTLMQLFQTPTIAQLAERLAQNQPAMTTPSLIPLRPDGRKSPIFCLPGNLGNVFTDLGDLARHLDPDHPFYGLQDGPHNPAKIETLAAYYLAQIRPVQAEGPYFLAGVCSGGAVAFEMARQLQRQGQQVALLALIEPSRPVTSKLAAYVGGATYVIGRLANRLTYHAGSFSQLHLHEQRTYVGIKKKLVANMLATKTYIVRPYPGRLDLFLTRQTLQNQVHPRLGWLQLAQEGVLHEISGSHDTITGAEGDRVEPTHMKDLARKLNERIAELQLQESHPDNDYEKLKADTFRPGI